MNHDDPRMANVVCIHAQNDYELGKNGLEIAEEWISTCLQAVFTVREQRAKDPRSFPGYGPDTPNETARRIVARLLDAGWRPADAECLDLPDDFEDAQ